MDHHKHETRNTHHVITLNASEINTALMMYACQKLKIAGVRRNSEPPYFQASSEPRTPHGAQVHLAGPISGGSVVQLVFDTVEELSSP